MNIPNKIKEILDLATPYLKQGRPGDLQHVHDMLEEVLAYTPKTFSIDLDVILPAVILHDIGHSAILPEHFKHLSGAERLPNSKLVHMLAGAKIAKEILDKVKYPQAKEVIEIVSIHDGDQVEGMGADIFDTENKKVFHDFDRMEIFNRDRIAKAMENYNYEQKQKMKKMAEKLLNEMFYDELKELAQQRWNTMQDLFE